MGRRRVIGEKSIHGPVDGRMEENMHRVVRNVSFVGILLMVLLFGLDEEVLATLQCTYSNPPACVWTQEGSSCSPWNYWCNDFCSGAVRYFDCFLVDEQASGACVC